MCGPIALSSEMSPSVSKSSPQRQARPVHTRFRSILWVVVAAILATAFLLTRGLDLGDEREPAASGRGASQGVSALGEGMANIAPSKHATGAREPGEAKLPAPTAGNPSAERVLALAQQASGYPPMHWPDAVYAAIAGLSLGELVDFLRHPAIAQRIDAALLAAKLTSVCGLPLVAHGSDSASRTPLFLSDWCSSLLSSRPDPRALHRELAVIDSQMVQFSNEIGYASINGQTDAQVSQRIREASLFELGNIVHETIAERRESLLGLQQRSLSRDEALLNRLAVTVETLLLCSIENRCDSGSLRVAFWCLGVVSSAIFSCIPGGSLQEQLERNLSPNERQYAAMLAERLYRLRYAP